MLHRYKKKWRSTWTLQKMNNGKIPNTLHIQCQYLWQIGVILKKVEEAYISKQCTFMMLEHHTRHFELVLQMKHYLKKCIANLIKREWKTIKYELFKEIPKNSKTTTAVFLAVFSDQRYSNSRTMKIPNKSWERLLNLQKKHYCELRTWRKNCTYEKSGFKFLEFRTNF